jgi:retron-type reverse transcriptase
MQGNKNLFHILGLPFFQNIGELASLIHIDEVKLNSFVSRSSNFYKKYTIPKKNGDKREIRQPNKELKGVQAWILRNILDKINCHECAKAFRRNMGLYQNIEPHKNNAYFICIDLEDFFPSINIKMIWKVFANMGYPYNAASILTALCVSDIGLPQGGVTSPAISNLVSLKLDRRIESFTSRRNIVYTRYADDMTFSSDEPSRLSRILTTIRKIINSEHLKINEDKLRILGPKSRCIVTGMIKNSSESRFGIGRDKKKKMRAIMHNMIKKNKVISKYLSIKSIEGWLNFVKSVDENSYEQMKSYWNKLQLN